MCMPTFDVSGESRGPHFSSTVTRSERGPGTSSDATAATHNEMGLPVDVLSEKREMQV